MGSTSLSKVRAEPPAEDRIPTSSLIPELAHYFLKEIHSKYRNPRLAIVTEKAAMRQILEVAKRSTVLLTALEQMSGAAENAFHLLNSAFFSKLMTQLRLLDVASNCADPPKLPPKAGEGRPKNIYAQRAADITARLPTRAKHHRLQPWDGWSGGRDSAPASCFALLCTCFARAAKSALRFAAFPP
jgi:hypothetical protein